ncbi:MAG: N-acetylneuraminate synthase family protein [Candidatus Rokubacteria bacterium]|nr:N-acetylneuraminate synthase family protein [Candidatus Rokubacteria bacterium]
MRTLIVAEIGANHLGNMDVAESMIRAAAEAGADIVKFQSWQAAKLRKDFPDFQAAYERHRRTQLSDADHERLIEACAKCGVEFLTTCFDVDRVDFLAGLGLKRIKVASPDCASFALIDRLKAKFEHLIISTGMSTDEEVQAMIRRVRGHRVTVLHCISLYPPPSHRVNMARLEWLRSQGVAVGFSDHTLGTDAGKFAIALGAEIVEKHFTLSRKLPGKDQAVSGEPSEFAELRRWAESVETMRGTATPGLSPEELTLRDIYMGKWGSNR